MFVGGEGGGDGSGECGSEDGGEGGSEGGGQGGSEGVDEVVCVGDVEGGREDVCKCSGEGCFEDGGSAV